MSLDDQSYLSTYWSLLLTRACYVTGIEDIEDAKRSVFLFFSALPDLSTTPETGVLAG